MALNVKKKKELSPDDLIEGAKSFEHWFEENWKSIAAVIGIIVAAVLLFFAVRSWNQSRIIATRTLLDEGLTQFHSATLSGDETSLAGALEKFEKAADGSGGPALAGRFYQGLTLMRLGRADEAIAPLTRVADGAGDALLARDARTALAQAWIASGKSDEAVAVLKTLSEGEDAYAAQALLTLGKMAENDGREADALAVYQELAERFADTPLGAEGAQEERRLSEGNDEG